MNDTRCSISEPVVKSCTSPYTAIPLEGYFLCYFFLKTAMTFDEVRQECQRSGGDISRTYTTAVDEILGQRKTTWYFVGLHYLFPEKEMIWAADNVTFDFTKQFHLFRPNLNLTGLDSRQCVIWEMGSWSISDCDSQINSYCFKKKFGHPSLYIDDFPDDGRLALTIDQKFVVRCTTLFSKNINLYVYFVDRDGNYSRIKTEPLPESYFAIDNECKLSVSVVSAAITIPPKFKLHRLACSTTGVTSECDERYPWCTVTEPITVYANKKPQITIHFKDNHKLLYADHVTKIDAHACIGEAGGLHFQMEWPNGREIQITDENSSLTTTWPKEGVCSKYTTQSFHLKPDKRYIGTNVSFLALSYTEGHEQRWSMQFSKKHTAEVAEYPDRPSLNISYSRGLTFPVLGELLDAECYGCIGTVGSMNWDLGGHSSSSIFSKVVALTASDGKNALSTFHVEKKADCRFGKAVLNLKIVEEMDNTRLSCRSMKEDEDTTAYSEVLTLTIPPNTAPVVKFQYPDHHELLYVDEEWEVQCEACIGETGSMDMRTRYASEEWTSVERLKVVEESQGQCQEYETFAYRGPVQPKRVGSSVSVMCISATHYGPVEVNTLNNTQQAVFGEKPDRPSLDVNYDEPPNIVSADRNLTANCSACLGTKGELFWELRDSGDNDLLEGYKTHWISSLTTKEPGCPRFGSSQILVHVFSEMKGARLVCLSYDTGNDTYSAASEAFLVEEDIPDEADPEKAYITFTLWDLWVALALVVFFTVLCFCLLCRATPESRWTHAASEEATGSQRVSESGELMSQEASGSRSFSHRDTIY